MTLPKVSIIIPTHNRSDILPRAVESARKAAEHAEIIVVDDASNDSTPEVCKSLEGIRYIRLDRNQGVASARNMGLLASSAEYIAFLDDDDTRLPGSVDMQVKALEANPEAGFVYSPVIVNDQNDTTIDRKRPAECPEGDIFWDLLEMKFTILLQATVIRKACFFRAGLLNSRLSGTEDWDISVRISELYPVVVVEQPASIYTEPTPFSGQATSTPARVCFQCAQHQLRLLRLPRAMAEPISRRREARKHLLQKLSGYLIWNAATWLPAGANQYARKNLLAALRLNPVGACRPGVFKLLLSSFMPQRQTRV